MSPTPRDSLDPDRFSVQVYLVNASCKASRRAADAEADRLLAKQRGDDLLVRTIDRQIAQDLTLMNMSRMLSRSSSSELNLLQRFFLWVLGVK